MIMKNFKNIEFTSDPRGRYIFMIIVLILLNENILMHPYHVVEYLGYRSIYLCWLILPMNDLLWNWVWGTDQDPNSGSIKNLIIDDYENNPNWKQNGYKTLQIENHTLEEVEIRCSISVILYFLAYIIVLMVS